MRHLLALPAVLRSITLLATASQHAFSVGDDILAFPQYEVRFTDDWISDKDATKMLSSEQDDAHVLPANDAASRDAPASQVGQYTPPPAWQTHGYIQTGNNVDYEFMRTGDGQRWLCSVPQVIKPADALRHNQTQSKAELERELTRASDRGWELLSGMQGNCVFFISGWWSYRFCYNQGVRQFHQLPPSRGMPTWPPVEDPGVPPFVLGTYDKRIEDEDVSKEEKWEGESALEMSEGAKRTRSVSGELVQRGESRYLVQRLGGGTACDLTGKERRIEIQFHCNPQTTDRISLIKETSTCAYLMVIQTPRLCNDVAFLPPQKDQPNSVSCQQILSPDEVEDYERDVKALQATETSGQASEATAATGATGAMDYEAPAQQLVGDIWVGSHAIVPEGLKIEKSAIVGGGKEKYIDTVASSDGRILAKDDLEKLGLGDPKNVEKLKKELENIAQGQIWKLDVIDTPQGREYRGIIGEDAQADGAQKRVGKPVDEEDKDVEGSEGSEEEFYKEEL